MNPCFSILIWLINTGHAYISKVSNTVKDIYLLLTVVPEILISPSGQIISNTMFEIVDSEQIWNYSNNCLYQSQQSQYKRLHILSCEFTYKEEVVSMDDFLENTKFSQESIPFPVFMAAFTLYSKKLYPWENADFNVFTRNGDSVQFRGNMQKHVEDIKGSDD